MNEPILTAKKLATELTKCRLTTVENELSKILRELSPEAKLEIIVEVMQRNVRAAAALANRGNLSVLQQISLLRLLLATGQSNAIKYMVSDVFVHRMGIKVFLHLLRENRNLFPESVHLAAYYFLGASKIDSENRIMLRALLDETKLNKVPASD
jgi:hypothetical protein